MAENSVFSNETGQVMFGSGGTYIKFRIVWEMRLNELPSIDKIDIDNFQRRK